MGETTDNINEVISTGENFALLAEVIEFLKKKRKKEENKENLNIDDDMVKVYGTGLLLSLLLINKLSVIA